MKAISKIVFAGVVSLALCSGSAMACDHRCYFNPNVQAVPVPSVPQNLPPLNNAPQPVPNPPATGNGLSQNDTIVNDLPVDAKRAIKAAAAKARANGSSRQISNSRKAIDARPSR